MVKIFTVLSMMGLLFLTGCASSTYKARQEQREKLASSAGLYCEWVNGDKHTDIDVELNLQMAKRCDSTKPFTLTPYKNAADQNGVMYCCATAASAEMAKAPVSSPRKASAPAAAAAAAQKPGAAPAAGSASAPAAGSTGPQSDEIVEDK